MVHKTSFVVVFILAVLLGIQVVSACHLALDDYYWNSVCSVSVSAGTWAWDFGGCATGFNPATSLYLKTTSCTAKTDVVVKSLTNGDPCQMKWGWFCDNSKQGRWDASESKCVTDCAGARENSAYQCVGSDGSSVADNECESGCAADAVCDEISPGTTFSDTCSATTLEVNKQCISNSCLYYSDKY
ncbi:MAG: hypothetical protein HZC29_02985, partial [Thaumarchaeota archaeon]|nr:hypothetical protein [Nitrososphaerota archaeon]